MKRLFLKLVVVIVFIASCNKEKNEVEEQNYSFNKEKVNFVPKVRQVIFKELSDFNSDYILPKKQYFSDEEMQIFSDYYQDNLEKIEEHGLEYYLVENKILKEEDIEILNFYQANRDKNINVYNLIKKEFPNFSEENNNNLITLIEMTNVVYDYYLTKFPESGISWRCAGAIGGTLIATAGFLTVPGPGWMLGIALASKVYATISLIDGCTNLFEKTRDDLLLDDDLFFHKETEIEPKK